MSRRTRSQGGAHEIKMLQWNRESLVSSQRDAGGGGKSCRGVSRCSKSPRQLPVQMNLPTFCYPASTRPNVFTSSLCRHGVSLQGRAMPLRAGDCGTSVVSWGQGCDCKWWERISGSAQGESGLPAVENQLVSRPAGPAPSVGHLLDPLGSAGKSLRFPRSSQRLCHSVWSCRSHSVSF